MQTSFLAEGPDYPRARRLLGLSGPNAKVCKDMQVHANLHKSECMALNKMCSAILVPINWRRSKNFNTCSSRGSSIKCNPITCLHHNNPSLTFKIQKHKITNLRQNYPGLQGIVVPFWAFGRVDVLRCRLLHQNGTICPHSPSE